MFKNTGFHIHAVQLTFAASFCTTENRGSLLILKETTQCERFRAETRFNGESTLKHCCNSTVHLRVVSSKGKLASLIRGGGIPADHFIWTGSRRCLAISWRAPGFGQNEPAVEGKHLAAFTLLVPVCLLSPALRAAPLLLCVVTIYHIQHCIYYINYLRCNKGGGAFAGLVPRADLEESFRRITREA